MLFNRFFGAGGGGLGTGFAVQALIPGPSSSQINATYLNVPLGPQAANRHIIMTHHRAATQAGTVTGVTVGGLPASVQSRNLSGASTFAISWLKFPSGIAADIVVSWAAGAIGNSMAVYSLDLGGDLVEGVMETSTNQASGPTMTLPPGHVMIGGACGRSTGGGVDVNMTRAQEWENQPGSSGEWLPGFNDLGVGIVEETFALKSAGGDRYFAGYQSFGRP